MSDRFAIYASREEMENLFGVTAERKSRICKRGILYTSKDFIVPIKFMCKIYAKMPSCEGLSQF